MTKCSENAGWIYSKMVLRLKWYLSQPANGEHQHHLFLVLSCCLSSLSSSALHPGQRAGPGRLLPQAQEDGGLWAAVRQPGRGGLPLLHLLLPALHRVLLPPHVAGGKHHVCVLRPGLLHLRPVQHVHHHRHQHQPLPEDMLQLSLWWGRLLVIGWGFGAWGNSVKWTGHITEFYSFSLLHIGYNIPFGNILTARLWLIKDLLHEKKQSRTVSVA